MKELVPHGVSAPVLPSLPHVSEVSARYLLSLQNCHCLPQMQSRKRSLRHITEPWKARK